MPTTDATRVFDGYVASYNFRTRNPNWVLEHLTQDGMDGDGVRWAAILFMPAAYLSRCVAGVSYHLCLRSPVCMIRPHVRSGAQTRAHT